MKTRYLKVLVVLGCTAVFMASCGKSEIEPYESKAKLWFTQDYYAGTPVTKHDANDVKRSFALFPGEKTLDIPFEINLIGDVAGNDRSYSVVVVDSLTTAVESEYKILSTTFRAEHSVDTLWVQLVKTDRLTTTEVKLSLQLVENDNFTIGYDKRVSASVTFNDITTPPDWWNENIELSYLGPFTKAKYEAFYAYYGSNEIDGLSSSDLRRIALGFRDYIDENKIKEADGQPMTVPVI